MDLDFSGIFLGFSGAILPFSKGLYGFRVALAWFWALQHGCGGFKRGVGLAFGRSGFKVCLIAIQVLIIIYFQKPRKKTVIRLSS